jgi:radical SAM protein with 4Fe4S-binding SPASM domain
MPGVNINDTINLFSKLTAARLWNGIKVLSSFYLSRFTKKPVQWGYPVSISFEPTTSCNLRCPECPSGLREFTRPTGMLKKDFLEMVKYASSKGIYTATSTNAHYLTDDAARKTIESGLDRLIISIDGTTQDVYEQYRIGGKLDKVLEGARNIVKWKKELNSKTPFVFFQFLVVKPNEHQIEDVKRLAKEIGVDEVRFKTAQVYDFENDPNKLIPETGKYSRYIKNQDGTYSAKNKLANHCWKLWHANVISWDGLVVPCCFDKDAMHQLGNLKNESFKKIWHNSNYKQFRSELMSSRKNIDICSNCSEGISVWK